MLSARILVAQHTRRRETHPTTAWHVLAREPTRCVFVVLFKRTESLGNHLKSTNAAAGAHTSFLQPRGPGQWPQTMSGFSIQEPPGPAGVSSTKHASVPYVGPLPFVKDDTQLSHCKHIPVVSTMNTLAPCQPKPPRLLY